MSNSSAAPGLRKRAACRFFGVILVIFGLFFIIPSQHEINEAMQARDWPPAKARITHSAVLRFGGSTVGTPDAPSYRADIRGVLLESGRAFALETISFGKIVTRGRVREYVGKNPVGAVVTVYVSPDDPSQVILEKEVDVTMMYLLEAIGGALLLIAVGLFIWSRRL